MTRPNRNMIRTNLYLPADLKTAMKALAKHQGTTYSEMVRRVMTNYVKTEIPKIKRGTA